MSKFPAVNYIGNKRKVNDWIVNLIPNDVNTILDAFAGGNSVSYKLKSKGFNVITNDILYSSYAISKALVENQSTKITREKLLLLKSRTNSVNINLLNQLSFLKNKLYFDHEVYELHLLLQLALKLKSYEKFLFISLLRRAMIRKLPYSRMNIEWDQIVKLRDENYSYQKYGRKRAYHNIPFFDHILGDLDSYNVAIFDSKTTCKSYNKDILSLLKSIQEPIDLIYFDPPYPGTMNDYHSFYGDIDKIFKKNKLNFINLQDKDSFLSNFNKILTFAVKKSKYVMFSINNNTQPTPSELRNLLEKFGNVKTLEKSHNYQLSGKNNKTSNTEIILLLEFKKDN